MKKFLLFLFAGALLSCSKTYKVQLHYTDVETHDLSFKFEDITAASDSAAYLAAYNSYAITAKAQAITEETTGKIYNKLIGWDLIDADGRTITNLVNFKHKDSLIAEIDNSITVAGERTRQNRTEVSFSRVKKDEAKIKELKPYFSIKKDEFDTSGKQWVTPKGAPNYVNRNGVYCYFQEDSLSASNLRFRLQYNADEWLFIQKVIFLADGKAYEYYPENYQNDVGNGDIVEWFDDSANTQSLSIMEAIANAKTAKMKLVGKQYHNIKVIPQTERLRIKRTLDYYRAKGGTLY